MISQQETHTNATHHIAARGKTEQCNSFQCNFPFFQKNSSWVSHASDTTGKTKKEIKTETSWRGKKWLRLKEKESLQIFYRLSYNQSGKKTYFQSNVLYKLWIIPFLLTKMQRKTLSTQQWVLIIAFNPHHKN